MKKPNNSDYQISLSAEPNNSSVQNSQFIKNQKKIRSKLKKERIYKQKNHGGWNHQEQEKFVNYMKAHRKIFENKDSRRSQKIFRRMSQSILTRSSEQCRSHHQKYEIKFIHFDTIVQHITTKVLNHKRQRIQRFNKQSEKIKQQFLKQPNMLGLKSKKQGHSSFKQKPPTKASERSRLLERGQGYEVSVVQHSAPNVSIFIDLSLFFSS